MARKTKDKSSPVEPLTPGRKTVAAMKAARRGEVVEVGSTDELLAALNAPDRTTMRVSAEAFAKFAARLNAAPRPIKRLRRTMKTRAPWEKT